MTRIVGWNVFEGGCRSEADDRIPGLVEALAGLAADVVVLSEITPATLDAWERGLGSIGYAHQASTIAQIVPPAKYGLVIAARREVQPIEVGRDCPNPSLVMAAEVGDLRVVGIHPPWNKAKGGETFYRWLRRTVEPMRRQRTVIVGDFNADPAEPERPDVELGPCVQGLLDDEWRLALREVDADGDHASTFWPDVGPRALDHALLAPVPTLRPAGARIEGPTAIPGVPAVGFGVDEGALSDHRPVVIDLR